MFSNQHMVYSVIKNLIYHHEGVTYKYFKVWGEKVVVLNEGMNILVVGKPKTGTTVVSKNIQNSMPNASYYLEPSDEKFYLSYPAANGNKLNVVKVLYEPYTKGLLQKVINNDFPFKFDKFIFIIRDPRDEFISSLMYWIFNHIKTVKELDLSHIKEWKELVKQKEINPSSISAIQLNEKAAEICNQNCLQSKILFFKDYYNFLQKQSTNNFILRYEDFIQYNIGSLERYLGFPLLGSRDVGHLKRTHRSGDYNNWKTFFTDQDIEFFRQHLEKEMANVGYTDFGLSPVNKLNEQHFSIYLNNLIHEATQARMQI